MDLYPTDGFDQCSYLLGLDFRILELQSGAVKIMNNNSMLPAVSYEAAMFSNEPRSEVSDFDIYFETEATLFHEAGHAVVGYMLGFGLKQVSVTIECRPMSDGSPLLGYASSGLYEISKQAHAKADRQIQTQGYGHAALTCGVMSCAGPAAEWRYRAEVGLPQRQLGSASGDHNEVDRIGKYLASGGSGAIRFRRRNRFAFRRLEPAPGSSRSCAADRAPLRSTL